MSGYDKELILREVLAVCDHYLPEERRREGRRYTYPCPECGDRNFEVEPNQGYAGCFDASCAMPTTTDSLGIIAHFKDKELRGRDFVECLRRGYEILGTPDPEETPPENERLRRREHVSSRTHKEGQAEMNEETSEDRDQPQTVSVPAVREGPEPHGPHGSGADSGTSSRRWGPANDGAQPRFRVAGEHPVQAWEERPDGSRVAVEAALVEGSGADGFSEVRAEEAGRSRIAPTGASEQTQINHAVYAALMKHCRLKERDLAFFEGRGVDRLTTTDGRFGSISEVRCRHVAGELEDRFPEDELLSVPGFYRSGGSRGELRFSIRGEYALIPYHDREGYIRTVEGRFAGQKMGPRDNKYKAPLNGGVHLYVHPQFSPDEVLAFCEGAIGAMVAARCGMAVASIKGMHNFRQAPEERGGDYSILPDLEGVDFCGRRVVFIPDLDVKPATREKTFSLVTAACEWLISRQGGEAAVATLPEGYKDLDEWLMDLEEEDRVPRFRELLTGATGVEDWEMAPPEAGREEVERGGRVWGQEEWRDSGATETEPVEEGPKEEAPTNEQPTENTAPSNRRREYSGKKPSAYSEGTSPEDSGEREDESEETTSEQSLQEEATQELARDDPGEPAGEAADIREQPVSSAPEEPATSSSSPLRPSMPEGELVLLAAVFFAAALALTAALHYPPVLSGLPWAPAAVLAVVIGAAIATGFRELRRRRWEKRLRHHVQGNDV